MTATELATAAVDALFDKADMNNNGRVTKRELKLALESHDELFAAALGLQAAADVRGLDAQGMLAAADLDGDGSCDREEFRKFFAASHQRLDAAARPAQPDGPSAAAVQGVRVVGDDLARQASRGR